MNHSTDPRRSVDEKQATSIADGTERSVDHLRFCGDGWGCSPATRGAFDPAARGFHTPDHRIGAEPSTRADRVRKARPGGGVERSPDVPTRDTEPAIANVHRSDRERRRVRNTPRP